MTTQPTRTQNLIRQCGHFDLTLEEMIDFHGMRDLDWSHAEKKAARAAFDNALQRECSAIRQDAERMLQRCSEPADVWRVHDYLSEKRLEVDRKYDYRYSVLIQVFGRLLAQGWVTEVDLVDLKPDKLELIRRSAAVQRELGA